MFLADIKTVKTGIPGLDTAIDMLRLGDNVVWQVESVEDYLKVLRPYVTQANSDNRRLVYFRFAFHEELLNEDEVSVLYKLDISLGFELFAMKIHEIIEAEGENTFYVFDCLSDLLESWHSDMMVGNFFSIACPFLYQLDTIAYFSIIRGFHTRDTVSRIRNTTQVLLDVFFIDEKLYIHPLKVWERHSPTMFFPHYIDGGRADSITSSADAAMIFSRLGRIPQRGDYWSRTLDKGEVYLKSGENTEEMKELFIDLLIGKEKRIKELAFRYFTLKDLLNIANRVIGTGFIGGKSVGMLLARKILENYFSENKDMDSLNNFESHDSYYIGSDIFYTYIVLNGWWKLRIEQKTPNGYFSIAQDLREKMLHGKFPDSIKEQFKEMLEHFGQSPIIVRSSSLREDNFGNAFAGKYESIFCANQGTPEERYDCFVNAIRRVYASTMNEDALSYRRHRGLENLDEQMAILVQRVSGNHYGDLFFPHIAGVGNSKNLYVWDKAMDPDAGMLRLVFGLGTRAVDRLSGDYAALVPLDKPGKGSPVKYGEEKKYSQHKADIINLCSNCLTDISLEEIYKCDLKTDKQMFFSTDNSELKRMRELGYSMDSPPIIADFKKLLSGTTFPKFVQEILKTLSYAYNYPVDIEFTVNFTPNGDFKLSILQCRPLQTKGLGRALEVPSPKPEKIFLAADSNFMGGNARIEIEYAVFIKTKEYLDLSEHDKYQTARLIGQINQKLKGKTILLLGPGRWGTTTPSLGVPVHFSELCNMSVICEISYPKAGLIPELSYGSHFFQDLVESDIFYAAIFDREEGVIFHEEKILKLKNLTREILGTDKWNEVIHIAKTQSLILHSDIGRQKLLIFWENN